MEVCQILTIRSLGYKRIVRDIGLVTRRNIILYVPILVSRHVHYA